MSVEQRTIEEDKAEEREAGWFEDACALVRRLVPAAETYEVQHAAERIVAQLQQVRASRRVMARRIAQHEALVSRCADMGSSKSERTDPLNFLLHQMTGRVRCICGWEGTPSAFNDHCGVPAWTDDEIRKAFG